MGAPTALVAYDLAFQVSPIVLMGGAYANSFGGGMPIIGLVGQLAALGQGLLSSGPNLEDFFARYVVQPGGTMLSFAVARYPFANQQTAANAVIQQPTNVSLEMICPSKSPGDYLTKLPILSSLQASLIQHINAGGTFNVATPAFLYTSGLLTNVQDVTPPQDMQKQTRWQFDFEFPLITQSQASAALNTLMGKLQNGGVVTSSATSGVSASPGTLVGANGLVAGAQLNQSASQ